MCCFDARLLISQRGELNFLLRARHDIELLYEVLLVLLDDARNRILGVNLLAT